ncbi:OsmC family protein [Mycobacterium vicinigordonae]|uniref:OsmC family protein n=1 Tax=Mycobacterium vicinigordonae TaxID=1719132 RepID=A0A7D6DWQ7_9MYCO|nr:OsmC family protein [Mycobacterium vicinigordonae]QLL06428.1 OsmC family protein [Mycobacterium vicinigordonae]
MTTSTSQLGAVIAATQDAVAQNRVNAQVVFRAAATAHDAVASTISLGQYQVEVDEPPALGGESKAPNPVEYYLASLLSCQIVTWRFWAEKLGIAVDEITAQAEGDLDVQGFFGFDDSVRAGFQEVRVLITVTGPETAQRYRELQEAVDAHCPVLDLTRNATSVLTRLELA